MWEHQRHLSPNISVERYGIIQVVHLLFPLILVHQIRIHLLENGKTNDDECGMENKTYDIDLLKTGIVLCIRVMFCSIFLMNAFSIYLEALRFDQLATNLNNKNTIFTSKPIWNIFCEDPLDYIWIVYMQYAYILVLNNIWLNLIVWCMDWIIQILRWHKWWTPIRQSYRQVDSRLLIRWRQFYDPLK